MIILGLGTVCRAEGESFDKRTVVHKGEFMANLSISDFSINSQNADLFLMLTKTDAKADMLQIAPFVEYAFKDNMSIGLRTSYNRIEGALDKVNFNLLSDQISFDFENIKAHSNSYGASLFYRYYMGLDRKGNFGFYCETSLGYRYGLIDAVIGESQSINSSYRLRCSFAPGVIIYVLPFVSLQAQVSLAHVSYNNAGRMHSLNAGFRPDLTDLYFGVSYHF